MARKHLLLGFGSTGACFREMRDLGFPQAYAHLGEEFETGEVTMDHHDDLARIYNVSTSSCNTFVFVPKCVPLSCCTRVYLIDDPDLWPASILIKCTPTARVWCTRQGREAGGGL